MKFWKRLVAGVSVSAIMFLLSVCAFATEDPSPGTETATADTVMTALTTGLTSAQGHMFTGIQNALPLALAVAGVVLGVMIGWRVFKRMGRG